ncbi:MAG: helix-turn-helix domain-containing protein, partial [Sphingomicrobium sp.]
LTPGEVIPAEAILVDREATALPDSRVRGRPPHRTVPDDDLTLRAAEHRHIRKVLEHTDGNKRQAARLLGLSRSTLDRKLGA